jgi:hypothetical protein
MGGYDQWHFKTRWCRSARSLFEHAQGLTTAPCSFPILLAGLATGNNELEFKSTPFCAKDVAVSLDVLKGKREPVVIGDLALNLDRGSNRLSVRVVPSPLPSSQKIDVPPIPWWPYLRRFITEARDRALPLVPSWIQRKS